jgi:hypothetical protein
VNDTIQLSVSGDVAADSFTGYSESLWGESGGSGWSGAWSDQGFSSSPNVIQDPLGTVNTVVSTAPYVEYPLNNSMGGINILEATRSLSSTVSSGTVYVYGLLAVGGAGGGSFSTASSYGGIGLYNGMTEKFLIGERWQAANWGATASGNLNGAGADSSTSIGTFTTALLCARIDFTARTLTLWVNPNFNQTESCSTTSASFNFGNNDASFNVVRLRAGNANNGNKWQFDNINITTVSPFAASGPTANVSGSTTICLGSSATISADLTGIGPWTVTWSDGAIQNASSSPATRSVSPTVSTSYTVTGLADSTGCSAGTLSGNAAVTVRAPATVNAGPDQTVPTSTTSVILSGTMGGGATTATWSGGGGTFEDFNNGTGRYLPTASERLVSRSVALTLTSGGQAPCAAVNDTVTITFNSPPVAASDTFPRAPGLPLKIRIPSLLTNDLDPDLDAFWLAGISAASTNNVVLYTNGSYIYYTNQLNVDDKFSYTVQDTFGGTSSGEVFILVRTNVFGLATHIELGTNSSVTASFAGVPEYAYQVQRATNLEFSGRLRLWDTNAPSAGLFQVFDDFSDLGTPPGAAYYRTRYSP